jgi:DNA-binding transcriptional LysR family regulator
MLDVDLLRTFVDIYESGSFTAASDIVGRTPAAVSLQGKKLEDQLGRALFVRGAARVSPTPAGDQLLSHARRILRAHDDAIVEFDRRRGTVEALTLGMSADYGQRVLPLVLSSLARRFPDMGVEVVCGPSSDIAQQTVEGKIELSFVGEGEALGDSPVVHRERCIWVTGGDAHHYDPLPLALPPRECLYRKWAVDRLTALGKRHRIAYSAYSIGAIQAIVRGGLAVSLLAESALVPGMREIDAAHGFGDLPDVEVRAFRSLARDSALLRDIEAAVVDDLLALPISPRRAA